MEGTGKELGKELWGLLYFFLLFFLEALVLRGKINFVAELGAGYWIR
jgi:hypothetical protein